MGWLRDAERAAMIHDESKVRLWLAHRAALVDYASGVTGSRAEAEDVVQDAYLRFVPANDAPGRDGAGTVVIQPLRYLYRIVRNLALDRLRPLALLDRFDDNPDGPGLDGLPSPLASPEQQAVSRDQLRHASAALNELSDPVRDAFVLHRIEGRTLAEVAGQLGVSVPTVHRMVRDALMRIAEKLEEGDVSHD